MIALFCHRMIYELMNHNGYFCWLWLCTLFTKCKASLRLLLHITSYFIGYWILSLFNTDYKYGNMGHLSQCKFSFQRTVRLFGLSQILVSFILYLFISWIRRKLFSIFSRVLKTVVRVYQILGAKTKIIQIPKVKRQCQTHRNAEKTLQSENTVKNI